MEKKYTITLRLTDMQYTLLGAICRRTKRTQSESTNLNQLARQANTYGFSAVAKRCEEMAERINQLIKRLKDDR